MPYVTDPRYAADWYQTLLDRGIPPNVAAQIVTQPSYAEGERPSITPQWRPPTPYQGQEVDPIAPPVGAGPNRHFAPRHDLGISYQPGGNDMAAAWGQGGGMPGMGAPGGGAGGDTPAWMRSMRPDQLLTLLQILGSKQGAGPTPVTPGAQPAANPLTQQSGQLMNPQMLGLMRYIQQMQNQGQPGGAGPAMQQGPGMGGLTLADLFARQPGGQNTGLPMAPAYNAQ